MGIRESENRPTLTFGYSVRWKDGSRKDHVMRLDAETLDLVRNAQEPTPEWTVLEFHRCQNCPLDPSKHRYCPVATALVPVINAFDGCASYDEVDVIVVGPERHYGKKTTLQEVAGSLAGISMVTGGCPILDRMRPLVRTHLPFPSSDEHSFRMIGMYLYAQFLLHREGRAADWSLSGLLSYYGQVETVNRFLCKRLNAVRVNDSDVAINAVNVLDSGMSLARLAIEEKDQTPWTSLFRWHWGTPFDEERKQ